MTYLAADRMSEQLSGGQKQRVVLVRSLFIKPDVLLKDETLGNLDVKLRVEMRSIIKKIQNFVVITIAFVTHDQEEALAASDRIADMSGGSTQHTGMLKNLYQRPAILFVSSFSGRTNLLKAKIEVTAAGADLVFADGYWATMTSIQRNTCGA